MNEFLRIPIALAASGIRSNIGRARISVRRGYARLWLHAIRFGSYLNRLAAHQGLLPLLAILLVLLGSSAYLALTLQPALESYFATDTRLETLRMLLLTLGGALIGASVIAFSLVMFAMQVNVERLPHGLFHRFSSDWRLLAEFGCTFVLAIVILAASLFPNASWLAVAIIGSFWGTFLILLLFLFAYRRALLLVNPLQQLRLVYEDANSQLRTWGRRADRVRPILENSLHDDQPPETSLARSTHDAARIAFFQLNPHWTTGPLRAIAHAVSFFRRYAEQGDHEVSRAALTVLVRINAAYVSAKGKTFFTQHLMLENPFTTDGFINNTLEYLRQGIRIGISRKDEQQIEQTFRAMWELVQVYLRIDYSTEPASKYHAILAAGYLSEAVQTTTPHGMPDVLMEGTRLLGSSARLFLNYAEPSDITPLTEKIALFACTGAVKEDHRPVTIVGMEQLVSLTFDLIRTTSRGIGYAAREIRKNIAMIAKLILTLPDTPFSSVHSACLAPYYSATSAQSLSWRLTQLVNAVCEAPGDDTDAKTIIGNLEKWADGLYNAEKELLLAAIEKRSHLTFDVIHWITHVTKLLLAVSNAPACGNHAREELRRHALWLISVLSWVPDDRDTVGFVENFQMIETLFEAATDAHSRGCEAVYLSIRDMLLSWTFKAGRRQTGWAILERGLCGLCVLALIRGGEQEVSGLKAAISQKLVSEDALDLEVRDDAAREIRRRADTLYEGGHSSSSIKRAMHQADEDTLRPLMKELANLLEPVTA